MSEKNQAHVYTVREYLEYGGHENEWPEWHVERDGIVIARCDEHLAAQHIAGLFNREEQLIAAYNMVVETQKSILRALGYPDVVVDSRFPGSHHTGGDSESGA